MRNAAMRAYAPGLLLLAGCLAVRSTRDQTAVSLDGPLASVVADVDGYRREEQHISDDERRVAGMTDYVARIFWRDSAVAFTTYVGYYDRQTRGKSIHSPRNCMPGAGWEVMQGGTATITSATGPHTVNRYILQNGRLRAVVYYWYQGRGRVVASEYAVKVNLLRDAALRGHTEEALARIVIPVEPADAIGQRYARADSLGRAITTRMIDDLDRVLPGMGGGAVKSPRAVVTSPRQHARASAPVAAIALRRNGLPANRAWGPAGTHDVRVATGR